MSRRLVHFSRRFGRTGRNASGPYQITNYTEIPGKQCSDGNRMEPAPGEVWPVRYDTVVYLGDNLGRGAFYADAACAHAVTSVSLRQG